MSIEESEALCSALVNVFQAQQRADILLKIAIVNEVRKSNDSAVLFRTNSIAMKLVSVFARRVGVDYYKLMIPVIQELFAHSARYEIDPSRVEADERVDSNAQRLLTLCQRFADTIFNSPESVPVEVRTAHRTPHTAHCTPHTAHRTPHTAHFTSCFG